MSARVLALLALAEAAACSKGANSASPTGAGGTGVIRCSSDVQCGGDPCLGGNCVSRAPSAPAWAIEIRPPSTSAAPLTELTGLPTSAGPLALKTDRSVAVHVAFNASSSTAMPSAAHVVLTVPSLIGGRPDLTFETGATTSMVTLHAPEGVLARTATVDLLPLSPSDEQSPPFSFAIDTLAENNTLTIPTNNVWLHGFLNNAVQQIPERPFVARAYQQGRLVSNLSVIAARGTANADGSFRLAIPAAATASPVTVQISPQDPLPKDPWFASKDWSLDNLEMDTITLPAYQTPQSFSIPIAGMAGELIANSYVRAATELMPQDRGTTRFAEDSLTDVITGAVQLDLIPGTATTARTYDLAIVPLAGTPFAATCSQVQVIAGGGPTSPAVVSPIFLIRRPVVSGTVVNAAGSPVAGVQVTASRDPETARLCSMTNAPATGPTTISTTTNAMGAFALALDQGAYQIDYDPPAGSWLPRLTEYNVAVSDYATRSVHLPPPALLEGQVSDADGMSVKNANIRIFEPRCAAGPDCKTPPILRGETLTDDSGNFRIVVAMPMPAN